MDESQDPKPHPHVDSLTHTPHEVAPDGNGVHPADKGKEELSIWFFCGMLTLGYGIVLVAQGIYEKVGNHQPHTVLAELQPTLWWGVCLLVFGLFYTIKFRPGKG